MIGWLTNMNKSKILKDLLYNGKTNFIMEAHNGLSAKIVEETGFDGIWASGLSMSASLGVRDTNELSCTQVCDICEFMTNGTQIPILLDGDSGFGDFNNFRLFVKKLEQIGVAGVCIEDKNFPKMCSFVESETQELANIEEFCGKIRAGKDASSNPDFVIVARVESFIVGKGLEETLKRAYAYADSGADALLIHSKLDNASEIEEFMKRWDNRKPIIIVPTKYYKEPIEKFIDMKISLIIWGNHNIRSSISAMRQVSRQIFEERTVQGVEKKITPIDEIFKLQNIDEYILAKEKYIPSKKN